ncbi:MAG: electron transfer flavoprotein subunit alpha/FixB family protein [Pseudonocardia sp.]|nr:electron transfer flavoprotein subunit alpha/FixB family protein [Pseudonocardia sp.]
MLLVVIDLDDDDGDGPGIGSADLLAYAGTLGGSTRAVTFGAGPARSAGPASPEEPGVPGGYRVRHELLTDYAPEALGESLAQLVTETGPDGVLAAATERGNEVMAQAAARLDLPLATHCVAVEPAEPWSLTRIRGGGMLLEDAELAAPVKLVTVAAGVTVTPETAGPGMADSGADGADGPGDRTEVVEFVPRLDPELARTRVVGRAERSAGVTLATAPVVVSGGRGVGSAEGYAVLEELADLLGGAVGCSRVATNNGWRPHSDQVGLTGVQIAPELYIACGISGATQHWVGCMNAHTILAINTDPEAPMVTRSTYAVLGDVHEVLPAVVAELRAVRALPRGDRVRA